MLSITTITFCKNASCPASQDLLAFQKGETTEKENATIWNHLESCEFCATEIDFYIHFPQDNAEIASVNIPLPLFQLAEALLNNRHKEFSLLNKLLTEIEPAAAEQI